MPQVMNDPVFYIAADDTGGNSSGSYTINFTPDSYADFTDSDSVRIYIQYVYSQQTGLYVLNNQVISERSLAGDSGGFFNIVVEHLATNSHGGGSNYVVISKDIYSIDEWIEKATGKILNSQFWRPRRDDASWNAVYHILFNRKAIGRFLPSLREYFDR